jgi:hypothetical protein
MLKYREYTPLPNAFLPHSSSNYYALEPEQYPHRLVLEVIASSEILLQCSNTESILRFQMHFFLTLAPITTLWNQNSIPTG